MFEEITADSFPNLMKTINPQIQEAKWTSSSRGTKQTTPKHIIKLLKTSDMERNLKNRSRKNTYWLNMKRHNRKDWRKET